MSKTKKSKNIFFYIGLPVYRLIFFCLFLTKKALKFFSQKSLFYLFLFLTAFSLYLIRIFFINLPNPQKLKDFPDKLSTKILDRNGVLLYQVFEDENRSLIPLEDLSPNTINAFLSAEDKDFYKHHGFSISGVMRAVYKNFFNQKTEGGSTITQQLVKNTLLTNEKTLIRKIKELILSVETEIYFSKDQILQLYLNQIGFGGPAYGIEEASKQYFGISAKDLNINQAAYLAGLTRAPSKYSPFGDNPNSGVERKNLILEQMYKNNFIDEKTYQENLNEKLTFQTSRKSITAPHFVMLVKDILVKEYGESTVYHGGLVVTTTLDSQLQKQAQKIISDEISKLNKLNVNNGAALVTNPKTGEVLAMVGSKDYFDFQNDGQVNLTTSLRQPGSSIKPLNYALAFENNKKPSDFIEDRPITVIYNNNQSWTPKNYDNKFHGKVSLKQSLANSYNIPSVLVLKENGIENFAGFAKKLGITTWNDPSRFGLSMALGSLEVKMTDLATAYSAFANQGTITPLQIIKQINNQENKSLLFRGCLTKDNDNVFYEQDSCSPKKVITQQTANEITDILSDNQARANSFGINSVLNIKGYKIAVKTGTSNDLRDNWAIGYNNEFLVSTWVGNNNNQPMSHIASGITGASPIWASIFLNLLKPKLASN